MAASKGKEYVAYLVSWTESERGWGQRPDGVSLHLTQEDAKDYISKHWEEEKKSNAGGGTPDIYVRNDFSEGKLVVINAKCHKDLVKAKSLHFWQNSVAKVLEEEYGEK